LRWKDETRLAQTQSADHVDGEKVRLEVAALMSAAVTSACIGTNAKCPTTHSHSLVPVPSIFTLHVIIVANICCSKNTYNYMPRFNNLVISPMPSKALANIFTLTLVAQ
jgi:hypothetical protein